MSQPTPDKLLEDPAITRELIHHAKLGDRSALDALLARLERLIRAAVRTEWPRTRFGYDSEDMYQTLIARFVRGFDQFRGDEKAQLLSWFKTALKRRGIDLARHLGRESQLDREPDDSGSGDVLSEAEGPATQAARRDEVAHMLAAVRQLQPEDREVIVEHDLKAVPLAELAQRAGITEEAMKKRAQRARQRLAELIGGSSSIQP